MKVWSKKGDILARYYNIKRSILQFYHKTMEWGTQELLGYKKTTKIYLLYYFIDVSMIICTNTDWIFLIMIARRVVRSFTPAFCCTGM